MALKTREGNGSALINAEGDDNWDILNGINEQQTLATAYEVTIADEGRTIECSKETAGTVNLDLITDITTAMDNQISDFNVTIKNIGAGVVTINTHASDTFDDGSTQSLTLNKYESIKLQTSNTSTIWNVLYRSSSIIDSYGEFPSGTAMLFYQATAPTGWTESGSLNDHAIRIASVSSGLGGDGTNGTSGFNTVFALTATDNYTLLEADVPAHTHGSSGSHTHTVPTALTDGSNQTYVKNNTNGSFTSNVTTTGTGAHTHTSVGGGGPHAHGIELRVKYANVIVAAKD